MPADKDEIICCWSAPPSGWSASHATLTGPAISSATLLNWRAIADVASFPSDPPGPGALPACNSPRVLSATSDLVVSMA